jgi:pyridoxamine 5'-phosphate oxidase-like protein
MSARSGGHLIDMPNGVRRNDPAGLAAAIVDENQYMTLATADRDGRPWASPVWYATADHREFFWVSSPDARHSRNLGSRPEVAIVIFDSTQPPGTGRGVYLAATATPVPDDDIDRGIAIFSAASTAKGAGAFARSDVEAPSRLRLYHATGIERFVLSSKDTRIPVDIEHPA